MIALVGGVQVRWWEAGGGRLGVGSGRTGGAPPRCAGGRWEVGDWVWWNPGRLYLLPAPIRSPCPSLTPPRAPLPLAVPRFPPRCCCRYVSPDEKGSNVLWFRK